MRYPTSHLSVSHTEMSISKFASVAPSYTGPMKAIGRRWAITRTGFTSDLFSEFLLSVQRILDPQINEEAFHRVSSVSTEVGSLFKISIS